jgi:hypothetical protein
MWGGNVFQNVKNLTSNLSSVAANLLDPDAEVEHMYYLRTSVLADLISQSVGTFTTGRR